jgi:pimeloyl-ACP methyl ester carboxylesterase
MIACVPESLGEPHFESHYAYRESVHLHYLRGGQGPEVLLLHGITDTAAYWGWTMRELACEYTVTALDQRGHGLSDAPAEGYAIADYVADAVHVIKRTMRAPVVVVGHSFGGWIANRLAASHPGLARALVLEDPPFAGAEARHPEPAERDAQRWEWFGWMRECKTLDRPGLLARCKREHPTWTDEDCALWADSKQQLRERVWQPHGVEFDFAWQEAAPQVRCPALLLYGDAASGSIVHAGNIATAKKLAPSWQFAHIDGAGHAIHRERPQQMLNAVRDFLASIC